MTEAKSTGGAWRALVVAYAVACLAFAAPPAHAQDETPAPEASEDLPEDASQADAAIGGDLDAEAEAEARAAQDRLLVGECLETLAARGAPARVCIDIVARACFSEPGSETTAGAIACEERERDAWAMLLVDASAALDPGMSNTERDRFAAAQDAWASYRDAQCAYEAALFEGGSLQGVERTACERRLTAERTIAIHERAADLEERR